MALELIEQYIISLRDPMIHFSPLSKTILFTLLVPLFSNNVLSVIASTIRTVALLSSFICSEYCYPHSSAAEQSELSWQWFVPAAFLPNMSWDWYLIPQSPSGPSLQLLKMLCFVGQCEWQSILLSTTFF
jgi:hypothetical protein